MSADSLVTSKTAIPPTSQEQLTEDQIRKKLTAELSHYLGHRYLLIVASALEKSIPGSWR